MLKLRPKGIAAILTAFLLIFSIVTYPVAEDVSHDNYSENNESEIQLQGNPGNIESNFNVDIGGEAEVGLEYDWNITKEIFDTVNEPIDTIEILPEETGTVKYKLTAQRFISTEDSKTYIISGNVTIKNKDKDATQGLQAVVKLISKGKRVGDQYKYTGVSDEIALGDEIAAGTTKTYGYSFEHMPDYIPMYKVEVEITTINYDGTLVRSTNEFDPKISQYLDKEASLTDIPDNPPGFAFIYSNGMTIDDEGILFIKNIREEDLTQDKYVFEYRADIENISAEKGTVATAANQALLKENDSDEEREANAELNITTGTEGGETPVLDVEVTKKADKDVVNPGEEITYTITVKNTGNSDVQAVTVEELLPPKTVFSGSTATWTKDPDKSNVYNHVVSEIRAGASIVLLFKIIVNSNFLELEQHRGTVTNEVTIFCDGDTNQNNNLASCNVEVQREEEEEFSGTITVYKRLGGKTGPGQRDVGIILLKYRNDIPVMMNSRQADIGWAEYREPQLTDYDGKVIFDNLPEGRYKIEEVDVPEGFEVLSYPDGNDITISKNKASGEITAINILKTVEGEAYKYGRKISGYKFHDKDNDGFRDEGEEGLKDWRIELWKVGRDIDTYVDHKITGDDGYFEFTDLEPGIYLLKEVKKEGWEELSPVAVEVSNKYDGNRIDIISLKGDADLINAMPEDNAAFVAEGRFGNPQATDHQLSIGKSTASPSDTAMFQWPNSAEPVDFYISYDKEERTVTYTTQYGEVTEDLSYSLEAGSPLPTDIFIRTRAAKSGSGIRVYNLVLNNIEIDGFSSAVNPDGSGTGILWIRGADLSRGFTLYGKMLMYWNDNTKPLYSNLAYQIKVGNANHSDEKTVYIGNVKEEKKTPTDPPGDNGGENVTRYTLTTRVDGEGTITPAPGKYTYKKGTVVELTAKPADGWVFEGWTGDELSGDNKITMNGDKSITAVFKKMAEVELPDEEVPVGPIDSGVEDGKDGDKPDDKVIDEPDEVKPDLPGTLPKTGGIPAMIFYAAGALLTMAGIMTGRKR